MDVRGGLVAPPGFPVRAIVPLLGLPWHYASYGSLPDAAGLPPGLNAAAVAQAFREAGVRTLIHGHTHRPAIHPLEIDGAPAKRIVLGDWYTQGSVLEVSQGGFELRTLPR